ncbi:FkbM family methyltransferase [Rhizobium sp.]
MLFAKEAAFSSQIKMLMQPGCGIYFSQFGEDVLLPMLFKNKRNGFYVDIGCFDPFKYSNTYILHSQFGWRGMNIDASPTAIQKFKTHRPNDININLGVSSSTDKLEFHTFKDGEVNTFNKEVAVQQSAKFGAFEVVTIDVEPLSEILSKFAGDQPIDYMDIDCEWLDFEVLQSNDWSRFRPEFLSVELHGFDLNEPQQNPSVLLLKDAGYRLHSFFYHTALFQRI